MEEGDKLTADLEASLYAKSTPEASEEDEESDGEIAQPAWVSLPENLYGHCIACIITEASKFNSDPKRYTKKAFIGWALLSFALIAFVIIFQVAVIWEFKRLVTSRIVHHVREIYDQYELAMYNGIDHTVETVNGFHRGVPEFFNPEHFVTLNSDLKDEVCQIPLSQPVFLGAILLVWTLTCMMDMRKCMALTLRLIYYTPSVSSIKEMTQMGNEGAIQVRGLQMWLKVVLLFIVVIPQLSVSAFFLWLGCRWLVATASLADVILNSLALEFVLLFKETFYEALLPPRLRAETERIKIMSRREGINVTGLLLPFFILCLGMTWVLLYMLVLQRVLPQYGWDVRGPCAAYLAEISAV